MQMTEKITWKEFRDNMLLWYVNRLLHIFGYAIIVEIDEGTGEITGANPARCKFRGFTEDIEREGYEKLTNHICEISDRLKKDVKGDR